ncbi:RNA polymerase sigma factor [Patescibacteria group bacterium]|nr:RNA polymerase sigma factor [Patescibacteria group bacterium]
MSIELKRNSTIDSKKPEIHIRPLNINKESFGALYDEHIKSIYRFIYFKVNSKEEAEDLASETFLKAWNYLSKAGNSNKIHNFKAFLYQIANNLVIDYYRKRSLLPTSLNDGEWEDANIPDGQLSGIEKIKKDDDAAELKKAFKKIPENYSTVVMWYYLEELGIPEIARIMGKSEGTVRVTIHRALKALKKVLESKLHFESKLNKEMIVPKMEMEPESETD